MAQQGAYGAEIRVFDTLDTLDYVAVAYVRDISGPSLTLDALDDTGHDSAGGAREFIGGLLDAGEVTLELHWDAANAAHDLLLTFMTSRREGVFQIEWPDATVDNFRAFVTGFEPSAPVDGLLTASATLRLNSFPILNDADGFDYLETEDGEPLLTENDELILINNLAP